MTRHILILGDNLAGLVTAYRLLHYGFHISILDTAHSVQPLDLTRTYLESKASATSASLAAHDEIPLILHGFYHATWALFQEISFDWPPHTCPPICLEFGVERGAPKALPQPSQLKWLHPLTKLTFFKNLAWSDRWHVINFLEKQWEDNGIPTHYPDNETVESWLVSAQQSEHSRSYFWNPLCRFFLHCDIAQASLCSFMQILSEYWFAQPTDATTFLTAAETLEQLKTTLRQHLRKKGAQFQTVIKTLNIQSNSEAIQAIEFDDQSINAHIFVSALDPQDLLPLLPERALARYNYFTSLAHIPELYGQAIRFTLHEIHLPPRLILHVNQFDWITSQPSAPPDPPKTFVTCVIAHVSTTQDYTDEWLVNTAWSCLQNLFALSTGHTKEASEPRVFRKTGPLFPCYSGTRTYRPLPQTPISNLYLSGPWTANKLPSSLESAITNANACADAVTKTFYGTPK